MGVDLNDMTVLVTGGTGSFGTAFVTRLLQADESVIVRVFSRDELKQSDLAARFDHHPRLRFVLGDVRDRRRLARAMHGVDLVVHAAAMKQVEACEYNPFEAVQTNVIGSQNVADAAIDAGVSRVVGVSTDKAVNPINLYGATKLCAEKLLIQANAYAANTSTSLCCVRYGNVVGSRGSVLPAFIEQRRSGRLRVTDQRMTRFWITLDRAVDLVLLALDRSVGGEVFVPRIPSVRVVDLAEALAPELPIDIVGIRPGEKLHETLITSDESRHTVVDGSTFVVLPEYPWWGESGAWTHATPVEDGFEYRSDTNDAWLGPDELRSLLA